MNPTMESAEALNPVVQKRKEALSQHKMWQLDFRYVRMCFSSEEQSAVVCPIGTNVLSIR